MSTPFFTQTLYEELGGDDIHSVWWLHCHHRDAIRAIEDVRSPFSFLIPSHTEPGEETAREAFPSIGLVGTGDCLAA